MAAVARIMSIVAPTKPPVRPKRVQEDQIDEKVMRRRQQYKFHQRRHRAKQKEKMMTLSQDVKALLTEIEFLNHQRQGLLVDRSCFSSRGTENGVPARLAMEYFRLFEYGISPTQTTQQEQFLRSIMTEKTVGPDYAGVETLITLWKRLRDFSVYTRYQLLSMDVATVVDSTVVLMDTKFHISCRRDGVLTLFPALNQHMELMQKVIGAMLVVPVQYRFEFDANGIVTWFSADWDLIGALNAIVSLVDAACILVNANISRTGQIQTVTEKENYTQGSFMMQPDPSEELEMVDPRYSVDFLLS